MYLRDFAQTICEDQNLALSSLILLSLRRWGLEPSIGWLNKNFNKGNFIIMFDGLDEVADPSSRRKVVLWVEKQMKAKHRNSYVITSRPFGYRENSISGVSVLEILPFNKGQIRDFVHNWYLANEIKSHQSNDPGVQMSAKSGADDLLRRLENSAAILEIAVNPLLLTMIATVHRFRSSLPGRRVELYKEICEVFLGKRQQSKRVFEKSCLS